MVGAGDLVRSDDGYRLSDRLLTRQRRQDDALNPRTRDWDGNWITLVVTAVGIDARTRAALRNTLQDKRFGELREGVWLRPDNLDDELPAEVADRVRVLHARDDDPAELAATLVGPARLGAAPAIGCSTTWPPPTTFPAGSSRPPAWCAICSPTRCCPTSCCRRDWPGARAAGGLRRLRRRTGRAARRGTTGGGEMSDETRYQG